MASMGKTNTHLLVILHSDPISYLSRTPAHEQEWHVCDNAQNVQNVSIVTYSHWTLNIERVNTHQNKYTAVCMLCVSFTTTNTFTQK